ncbi:MAG: helix-turn-helix domain-containing protein [Clostridiales bacterium]
MKNKLLKIGFTEYEAKAYISLLAQNPATAYEIAKNSSIPTSKIYEVLAKLVDKEIIMVIEKDKKKKYVPKNPDEMIESYKSKMENTLEELKVNLNNISVNNDLSYIWNIIDYDYLIDTANRIITDSKKELLISVWPEELILIKDCLHKARENNVKIAIVNFSDTDDDLGQVYKHPIRDTIYSEKGGRGFVIISDSKEVLFGMVDDQNNVQGANSLNSGFIAMAEDYIKHDIYIMKIIKRFEKNLIERFGENYYLLRDVFNDNDFKN